MKREVADSSKKDVKDSEDSPVMGLLTGHKTTKVEREEAKGSENKEVPSESTIKKAIRKRSSYIKANSEYAASSCKFVAKFGYCFNLL